MYSGAGVETTVSLAVGAAATNARRSDEVLVPAELRARRKGLGLTQAGLAGMLGVTPNTLARWERGEQPIGHPERIRRALDSLADGQPSSKERRWPPGLPAEPNSFVGREREVADATRLLESHRLVTLTGTGGVGKTRLALRIATGMSDRFADGVMFVPLAAIGDPRLVTLAIALLLGVPEAGGQATTELLQHVLRDRQLLLLLDNFEQVVAAGPLVAALLAGCPQLKVLVTSRAPLHLSGEQTVPVPPLNLPGPDSPRSVDDLTQCEAVRLFVDRARSVKPDFALGDSSASAVVEICRRLDGLPLAIELAAGRVWVLSPQAIVARLGRRLEFLVDGPRDAPSRQHTLRATIAWSYDLLDSRRQMLFRRLAVFAGGWTVDAAEAVVGSATEPASISHDMLAALTELIDLGLVQVDQQPDGESRFRLLETIREFGFEHLTTSGEEPTIRHSHAAYFLTLAEELGSEEATWGSQGKTCLDRLEREQDNLRAALRWALDGGAPEMAMRLAAAQTQFWFLRGYYAEGQRWLAEALSLPEAQRPTRLRALLLSGAAVQAMRLAEYEATRALDSERLRLARDLGDQRLEAWALQGQGAVASRRGDDRAAVDLHTRVLELCRIVDYPQREAMALCNLGRLAYHRGEYPTAREHGVDAVAVGRRLGSAFLTANGLRTLGFALLGQRKLGCARRCFEEGLAMAEKQDLRGVTGDLLQGLGHVAAAEGNDAEAQTRFARSLRVWQQIGERWGVPRCLEALAAVAAHCGCWESALTWAGAADAVRDTLPARRSWLEERQLQAWLTQARQVLDHATLEHGWGVGRGMPVDQAVLLALEAAPMSQSAARHPGVPLTARQRQVAVLVSRGHTNQQIAAQLVVTERTVEHHVSHILDRLGLQTRTHIATWVLARTPSTSGREAR